MLNKRQKSTVVKGCLAAFALGMIFIPKWTKQNDEEYKNAHRFMEVETEAESFEETEAVEETAEISTEDLQAEADAVASTIANATTPAATTSAPTTSYAAPVATAPAPIVWGTSEVTETSSEASGPVVSDETPDVSELPPIKEIPEDTETTATATEPAHVVIEQPGESSVAAPVATEPETNLAEHLHMEVQQGNYLMVYCTDVKEAYVDGFTIYRPWEDRPY